MEKNISKSKLWGEWREKIIEFQEWRKVTWDGSEESKKMDKKSSSLIKNFIEQCNVNGSVLDIGCAGGKTRNFLKGCKYFGIDPLIIKDTNYKFLFTIGVGEHLPFKDKSFDNVLIIATLDHVLSPPKVMQEVHRVLRDNGYLFLLSSVMPSKNREPLAEVALKKLKNREFLALISGAFDLLKSKLFSKNMDLGHTYEYSSEDILNLLSKFKIVRSLEKENISYVIAEKNTPLGEKS